MSDGDLIGFGCRTKSAHNNDPMDRKYFVYRVAIGCGFDAFETIELLSDDSDNEENGHNNSYNDTNSIFDGSDTDEDQSADEMMDIKPDIHKLMRVAYEKVQIKKEIDWNCYEYDKRKNRSPVANETNNSTTVGDVICLSDSDEEIVTVEPPRKRVRQLEEPLVSEVPETKTTKDCENHSPKRHATTNLNEANHQAARAPEYQMSETTLKEKVKNVQRSRAQQLATDLLKSSTLRDNAVPSTSSLRPNGFQSEPQHNDRPKEALMDDFIGEITKWDVNWLLEKKENPLRYQMEVNRLETNFKDLPTFQK